jgi:hypothetical protein
VTTGIVSPERRTLIRFTLRLRRRY